MSFTLVFPKANRTPSDGSLHLTQGHLFSDVSDEDRSSRLKHLNAIDATLPGKKPISILMNPAGWHQILGFLELVPGENTGLMFFFKTKMGCYHW